MRGSGSSRASGLAGATDASTCFCAREGWLVNRKRIHRLYREEGLAVRRRVGDDGARYHDRCVTHSAIRTSGGAWTSSWTR